MVAVHLHREEEERPSEEEEHQEREAWKTLGLHRVLLHPGESLDDSWWVVEVRPWEVVVPPFARPPVRWESEAEDDEAVAFLENYWSFLNLWDLLEERVVVVVHERMEHVLDQVLLDLLDQVLPDMVLYRRRFREVVPREEVALQDQHVLQ